MAITVTEYIERLTITTADDGTRTTHRTATADTRTAYLFSELSPEAQQRAAEDAAEEEENAYYAGQTWSMTYVTESEIWNCAEYLAGQQPVEFSTDWGGSYCGKTRPRGGCEPWEVVTVAEDNGTCFSMDLCDRWNEYAPRIIQQRDAYSHAVQVLEDYWEFYQAAERDGDEQRARYYYNEYQYYDQTSDKIAEYAERLTEEAAAEVGNVLDSLMESGRDYYQSTEFWYEWLDDGETRFDRDGKRIS